MKRALVTLLTGTLMAGSARAQEPQGTCTLRENPGRQVQFNNRGTPLENWYVTEAVFDCPDGRRLVAQTATYSVANGQITLNGSVFVEDPERSLTSEFAQYFVESRQLHARTNVVLTDKANGSVITSELLDAFEESPQRPQGLVIATGGAPRAVLYQERDEGGRDSTVVNAREIRIEGEESFRATGDAVMRRDSLTASGNVIDFAQNASTLEVSGNARIELPQQVLVGDSITATVDDQDRVRDVLSRRGARLDAEEVDVTGPAIRLLFDSGEVTRLIAMPWETGTPQAQPFVESEQFRMRADSIDVLAPDQQLTTAIAVGNAYGERILPDSLRALLPEASADVLALLSSDWLRGDTVQAHFAPNPLAETDSTADATILQQLTAHGDQAQSMYGVRDDNDPTAKLSFNYLRSSYIEVNFENGTVSNVAAAGDARGVYLQPGEAARATSTAGSGTTRRQP